MFADVVGSTALGERTEPEVLQRMMTAHAVLAREIIESNGGLVEKFIGDAVMAVLGLPIVMGTMPAADAFVVSRTRQ